MSGYIKREDAIFVALQQPLYSVVSQIKQLEGIDIVRCKECKYFIDNLTEDDADEVYGQCCFDWDIKMPQADDYCSYGEREGE